MIAKLLGVSESTVKTFVTRIYEKLEVRTRLDLLSLAIERAGCRMRVTKSRINQWKALERVSLECMHKRLN
jgi:hypothetical protein